MNSDLLYSLGLDVTGFSAGAKETLAQTKEIKHGLRGIKDVITIGGLATAVTAFFRESVQHALSLTGAVDDNTAAAQRWGKAMAQTRTESLGLGAQVVGFFTRGSEAVGVFFRGIAEAAGAFFTTTGGLEERGRAAFNALELARSAHLKDVELTRQELQDGLKRNTQLEEQKRLRSELTKEAERLADKERTYLLARLTAEERVNAIANEYRAKQQQIADFTGSELERKKLFNEYADLGLQLLKAQDEAAKEVADESERAAKAEQAKAASAAETAEKLARQAIKQREIADEVDRLNRRAMEQTVFGLVSSKYSGDQIRAAESDALREAVRRLQNELTLMRGAGDGVYDFGVSGRSFGALKNRNTIAQLEAELALRDEVARRSSGDRGLAQTPLDPLLFDQLRKEFTGTLDQQQETNRILKRGIPVIVVNPPRPIGQG